MISAAYLDIDSPAYQSPAYRAQLGALKIVNDCFEGTPAIKGGGRNYLPQEEQERLKSYRVRLARSTFWNAYRRTVMGLVGMVFRKSPILEADVPAVIKKQMENVDMMRSRMDVFAKEVFKWSVAEGHCGILVDMPPKVVKPEATYADDSPVFADRNGMRPYWSLYRKAQVINWRLKANKLVQLTLAEDSSTSEGKYGEKPIQRFRVLRPGQWELFELGSDGKVGTVSAGDSSLKEIPFSIISANKDSHMTSIPPLLDLAYENLRHYRLQSDLDHILHVLNVPILVEEEGEQEGLEGQLAGGKLTELPGQKSERVISPNTIYRVGKGGSLKFVEHQGHATGELRKEIETTKGNLATLGLSLLANAPEVSSTATENVLEYEAETSELAGMAGSLEDGLELALSFQAQYQEIGEDGGSVKVNRDFTRWKIDGPMIGGLAMLVQNKGLSLETMWSVLQQGDLLAVDFDAKAELARLLSEAAFLGARAGRAGAGSGAIQ
jgi:uncharacterized protein DUF4055